MLRDHKQPGGTLGRITQHPRAQPGTCCEICSLWVIAAASCQHPRAQPGTCCEGELDPRASPAPAGQHPRAQPGTCCEDDTIDQKGLVSLPTPPSAAGHMLRAVWRPRGASRPRSNTPERSRAHAARPSPMPRPRRTRAQHPRAQPGTCCELASQPRSTRSFADQHPRAQPGTCCESQLGIEVPSAPHANTPERSRAHAARVSDLDDRRPIAGQHPERSRADAASASVVPTNQVFASQHPERSRADAASVERLAGLPRAGAAQHPERSRADAARRLARWRPGRPPPNTPSAAGQMLRGTIPGAQHRADAGRDLSGGVMSEKTCYMSGFRA